MRGSGVVRLNASLVLVLVFVNFCLTKKEKRKKKENCCHSQKLFTLQMKCFLIFAKVFTRNSSQKLLFAKVFLKKFCDF